MTHVLALDQGTTSSRAILFDAGMRGIAMAQQEFGQIYPASGWVEHDPEALWRTTLVTARQAIARGGITPGQIAAIGITNQRETVVVWDRKTGKPIGNAIFLSDDTVTVAKKVHGMYTDPNRIRADIPGNVEGNPVFTYLDHFDPDKALVEELKARYRAGKVGDVEVKARLTASLNAFLDPIRERAAYYAGQSGLVDEIIFQGTMRYREIAAATLREVKKAMGLQATFNRIARKAEERAKKAAKAAAGAA